MGQCSRRGTAENGAGREDHGGQEAQGEPYDQLSAAALGRLCRPGKIGDRPGWQYAGLGFRAASSILTGCNALEFVDGIASA